MSVAPRSLRPGDTVRTIVQNPYGHTRLPGYVSGRRGRIVACQGDFALPDAAVVGDTRIEPVYTVCFSGAEVWGPHAEPNSEVCADLWASYLESGSVVSEGEAP